MNEFSHLSEENLKIMLHSLMAYKQGAIDTLELVIENLQNVNLKTISLYDEKIALCEQELQKYKV